MNAQVWCRLCGDHPATIGKGLDEIPVLCDTCSKLADAASELDRLYFEAHPDENVYYREPLPGELFGEVTQPNGIDESRVHRMVQVRRLGPGLRTRELMWVVS